MSVKLVRIVPKPVLTDYVDAWLSDSIRLRIMKNGDLYVDAGFCHAEPDVWGNSKGVMFLKPHEWVQIAKEVLRLFEKEKDELERDE